MTTYPAPANPLSALARADGTTVAHSDDHGNIIGASISAKKYLKGDGTTEDPAQVAALVAATSGGSGTQVRHVEWPAGNYVLSDGTGVDLFDGVHHYGHGRRTTISVKNAYGFLSPATSSNDTCVEGLVVVLRAGSVTGGAVKYRASSGVIHTDVRLSHVHGGGADATATEPAFYLGGLIGAHLEGCGGGGSPVGFYWTPDGSYSNANSMRRCRSVNASNPQTFNGINAGLFGDETTNLGIRDCIFESSYTGYGIYGDGCNNVLIDGCWFEANDDDNVHLVDSAYCNVVNNKFHYNNGNTPAAMHINLRHTGGANGHQSHMILGNHYQDASTSGTNLSIGANVEETLVMGGDVSSIVDSGTRSVILSGSAMTLPGALAKLKILTARAAAAVGGNPASPESVFSVSNAAATNLFMIGTRGVPMFRTADAAAITGSDELSTNMFALYWDEATSQIKARVRNGSGSYSTHTLSN